MSCVCARAGGCKYSQPRNRPLQEGQRDSRIGRRNSGALVRVQFSVSLELPALPSNPSISPCYFGCCRFESQHLLKAFERHNVKRWVALSEGAGGALGWLTTHERKEVRCANHMCSPQPTSPNDTHPVPSLYRATGNVPSTSRCIDRWFYHIQLPFLFN